MLGSLDTNRVLLSLLPPMGDILNLGQVVLLCLLSLMKIPPGLQVEPKISQDTKESSQTQRGTGRNTPPLINQFINPCLLMILNALLSPSAEYNTQYVLEPIAQIDTL